MALPVFMQLVTMFILLFMGYALVKKGFISPVQSKGLSIVLTKIAVPCNIIVLMQREYSFEILTAFMKTAGVTFLLCGASAIVFYIVGKLLHLELRALGLFSASGANNNMIFMGQPLILAMYGNDGLIYCVAAMFSSYVFLFLVCSCLFALGGEYKKTAAETIKGAFLNLVCFACAVGLGLFVTSTTLPSPIYNSLNYAAVTTVCISMVYIGTLLAAANIKEIFKDKIVWIFCGLTLFVMPIIARLVAPFFLEGMALGVVVVLLGTPCAAANASFADLYGNDAGRASEYVFVSTLLSMISLPLVAQFLCT